MHYFYINFFRLGGVDGDVITIYALDDILLIVNELSPLNLCGL